MINKIEELSLVSKHHPISPRKMLLVAEMIRNREVSASLINLKNSCQKSSSIFYKILNSARKQFINRFPQESSSQIIYVSDAVVGKGKITKKISFRARGRTDTVRERKCHVMITLKSTGESSNLLKKGLK